MIGRALSGDIFPKAPPPLSPIAGLPQELVGMIIKYLAYDRPSLRACCMTCYSWYITAVPHLHHTQIVRINTKGRNGEWLWPLPIFNMSFFGVFPLVKDLRIHGDFGDSFSPKLLHWGAVYYNFLELTNVQNLQIKHLDIPSSISRVQQYFGHFLPTVRSLSLISPQGSTRQIVFFIGLFRHLEDLSLRDVPSQIDMGNNSTLIPPFSPPLGGRLVAWHLGRGDLIKRMVDLFGGIRFSRADITEVAETRLLLNACSKTLRALQLHPDDSRGKQLHLNHTRSPANGFPARSSLQDFDLSQNKCLWGLETPARIADTSFWGNSAELFKYALSTIKPSADCKVTLVYQEPCFRGIRIWESSDWHHLKELSQFERAEEASAHHKRFELLRELHKIRDFQVELRVSVWGPVGEYSVRTLEEAVAAEKERKGFDGFSSPPSVTYNPSRVRWCPPGATPPG